MDRWGFTVVFVTHDVREAVRLGDRVLVLTSRPGRVAAEIPGAAASAEAGDPAAAKLVAEITGRLREEVRRHATD